MKVLIKMLLAAGLGLALTACAAKELGDEVYASVPPVNSTGPGSAGSVLNPVPVPVNNASGVSTGATTLPSR